MGENTKIEWCDSTWNPWVGCTKVSPACDHCYAEGWAKRAGSPELWAGQRRRTTAANWRQPLKWNKEAEASGVRRKVFCASLADVFDNQVPTEWRKDLFDLIDATPSLDWLLLTKRPQNIAKLMPRFAVPVWDEGARDYCDAPAMRANVWLGTTVENQAEVERRVSHLLDVPAAVHFLSVEPLLEAVSFRWMSGKYYREKYEAGGVNEYDGLRRLDWIIVGGESGAGRRPMDLAWMRSIRDECAAAGVPFFGKQDDGRRELPPDLMVRQFPERPGRRVSGRVV